MPPPGAHRLPPANRHWRFTCRNEALPPTSQSSSAPSRSCSSSPWPCRSTSRPATPKNPLPFIDFSRDRARARVRALHADPDARGGLRRALQPGGHPGADRAAPDHAGRRGDLHRRPARGRRGRRAADQGPARGRGRRRELRRRGGLEAPRRRRLPGHGRRVASAPSSWSGRSSAWRSTRRGQGLGGARHRRDAGPGRDGLRRRSPAPASTRRAPSGPRWSPASSAAATTSSSSTCSRR